MPDLQPDIPQDLEPWLQPGYPISDVIQAQAVLARNDVELYCDLANTFEGYKVIPHGIHSLLHKALRCARQSHQICEIVFPPEHGKTLNIEKAVVYDIAHFAGLRSVCVSKSEKTAERNLSHIRKTLISPLTKIMWPHIHPDVKRSVSGGGWSKDKLCLEGQIDPAVQSFSLHADSQGQRFDLEWFDDISTIQDRFSPAEREDTIATLHEQWLPRLTDDGLAIITNNAWHTEDAIHLAIKSPSFLVLWIGYVGTDHFYWRVHHPPECWQGKTSGTLPLWDVWPQERLERRRAAHPPAYKRQFNQEAMVADEMRLPPPSSWHTYRPDEIPTPETGARAFAYLDIAGGRNVEKNDFAALVEGVLSREKVLFVTNIWIDRCPPARQVQQIWNARSRMQALGFPGLHLSWWETLPKDERWFSEAIESYVRNLANGKIIEDLKDWPKFYPDYPDTTMSKEGRIERLHGPLENGDVRFPAGFQDWRHEDSLRGKSWNTFLIQMENFGAKGNDHDDGPDALEGLRFKAMSIGPGLAAPGSGIVGPLEQRRDMRASSERHKIGNVIVDLKTGKIKVLGERRGFI